ncbi:Ig-like domain repeat protein [Methanobrevibacter sp.]|uniref:Ig-like domain repeat protein n=1 Tax=Methanobrevibacter sp. TaxID=66852 RepID=UPI00388E7220
MKYKKSMIMLVLAIFIFGVASVCASDANTAVAASVGGQATEIMDINEIESNDVVYDDSQILGLSNSNEILKEPATVTNHTFDAIQSAIDGGYDTIYLEPGTYTGTSEIGIDGKETVNIIGNSTILDAQGQTEIFLISNSKNVVIHNITFVNGNFEDGGAIMVFHSDNVQIIDCTFTNNTASVMGGAIMSTSANVQVINSTFTNNKANNNGGAIGWMISTVKVEGCIFTNNTAEGYSIVGGESSSVQITTSIFTKNSANAIVYFLGSSGTDISVNNNIFLNNNGTPINFDVSESNGEYNWFGHNQSNHKDSPGIKYCTKWLFLNATANPDTISVSDTSDITFTIWVFDSSNNNTNEYDKNLLKPVDLTITATNGNVSSDTAKFGDTVKYTATRGGTAGVTASIENAAYTIPLNVNKENPNLSIVDGEVPYAENTTLTLNYNSAATGKVNITLNGKKHNEIFDDMDLNSTINLEGILPDEYDVMVTYSGDDSFLNATASGKLTVLKLDSNITVESYDINVTDQDGIMFKITLPKNATGNMTLSNGKTIDVTKEGKKGKKVLTVEIRNDAYPVGEYKWTFNYLGDDIYKNSTDQATSNILIIETKIIPKNKTIEMFCNDKSEVNYTTEPDDLKGITFKSSNTSVVTVNSKGIIKGVGEGKAHITLSFKGNENYTDCEASVTVTVSKIPTEIILNQTTLDLNVGDEVNPGVGIIPSDAGELDYTSGDVSVVIIDGDGTFTAVAEGSANVTIAFYGNDKYAAADSKVIIVMVSKIPTEILIQNTTLDMKVDDVADPVVSLMPSNAGNLSYKVSDDSVILINDDGVVTAVGEGTASVTVSFEGNDKYLPSNATIDVTVTLNDAKVDAKDMELTVDSKGTINYTTTPKDLNVSFVPDDSGVVNVTTDGTVTALKNGTAQITVLVGDGKKYALNSTVITVTVSKVPTEITVDPASLDLSVGDETVIVANLTPADAGNVTFTSSDDSIVLVDAQGNVIANAKGQVIITVSFVGNNKYAAAENKTITVNVKLDDCNVTVDNDTLDLKVGETCAINATKHPDTILLDIAYTSSDESVATVDKNGVVTAVGEGTAIITVEVGDDEIYALNSTNVTVTVSLNDASVSANDMILTVGENATVKFTTNPQGLNVSFVPDDSGIIKVDENGVVTGVKEGTASITVKVGDGKVYALNSTVITVTVNEKPSPSKENLTISASAEPITAGENATVKVTGLENATGEISLIANGETYTAPIKNGEATVIVPGLTENTEAYVNYIGDDKYNAASTTVNITVKPAPGPDKKNLTIKATAEPITVGENATVKVTGLENATGEIFLTTNGKTYTAPIKNGEASITVPGLKESTKAEISYPGDDKYNNASTTVVIVVNPAPEPSRKNLTISASADPITAGENVTVKVTGLENATGEVSVIANGETYTAPIEKGEATVIVPGLTENTEAYVNYIGDDKYNAATTTVNITVNPKGKENATISIDAPAEATEGDNVTVTVTLPDDATGTVNIGNEAVPIVNGTATAVLTNLPAGNVTVPITYSGDEKYNPIETSISINVKEDESIIVKAPDVTKYYRGPERFVVNVTDSKGKALANKTVTITINSVDYNRTTNASGQASLAINLNSGEYPVVVTYNDTSVNATVTVLSTVNGTDLVKVFRNATQFYATFLDSQGNYLAKGTVITFNINGVFYNRTVDENGLAKLNINLNQGKYIITSINTVTGESAANNIAVIPRIIENSDITKYYRNATQYTVKLIGDDGKTVGAGEIVTFNINGVFYNRTTNESGIAKLNINLQPGDYIITAEYKGCAVSNNIKVLPILNASNITMKYRDGTQFKATLVDGEGKPYAGQSVTFNINGVFYNRITDSSGMAKLNINLMPGEYIITSSYNGTSIANKITIKS